MFGPDMPLTAVLVLQRIPAIPATFFRTYPDPSRLRSLDLSQDMHSNGIMLRVLVRGLLSEVEPAMQGHKIILGLSLDLSEHMMNLRLNYVGGDVAEALPKLQDEKHQSSLLQRCIAAQHDM